MDEQTDAKRRWPIRQAAVVAVAAAWMIGCLVRWTVRDSWAVTSIVYYGLPVPLLLISGTLILIGIQRHLKVVEEQRPKIRLVVNLSLVAVLLIQAMNWIPDAYRFGNVKTNSSQAWRLMVWNTYHGELGEVDIAKELARSNCDLIALVESPDQSTTPNVWRQHLSDYSPHRLGAQITILVRKKETPVEVIDVKNGNLPNAIRYRIAKLQHGELVFRVIIVDINSDPFRYRQREFQDLAKLARAFEDAPLIITGDFNTPADSDHSAFLKDAGLSNTFEECGVGYRETWPAFFPLLALDQVWTNSRIQCRQSWREASWNSDHRRVLVEFEFKTKTQTDRN